jgi:hypothetical protein
LEERHPARYIATVVKGIKKAYKKVPVLHKDI